MAFMSRETVRKPFKRIANFHGCVSVLPDCDVRWPKGQYDNPLSPRVYEVVGRTENVFNFVAVQRRYLVAAEDIEELCRIHTITGAHAKTKENMLLIEVEQIEVLFFTHLTLASFGIINFLG